MPTVQIKGTIVSNDDKWIYDWFDIESVSPKDVAQSLQEAMGQDVTIEINSGGGDVFAGNEISYLISQYKGTTTADIVGLCGSAATLPACAANKTRIIPSGMVMIHNVSSMAQGDYHAMDKQSEVLKVANQAISNSYRAKTGMSQKDLLTLMDKETWMDAQKALQNKFVDEIINDPSGSLNNQKITGLQNSFANVLSKEVIEKVRNTIKCPNGQTDSDFLIQKAKAQLNFLTLKGATKHEI